MPLESSPLEDYLLGLSFFTFFFFFCGSVLIKGGVVSSRDMKGPLSMQEVNQMRWGEGTEAF